MLNKREVDQFLNISGKFIVRSITSGDKSGPTRFSFVRDANGNLLRFDSQISADKCATELTAKHASGSATWSRY